PTGLQSANRSSVSQPVFSQPTGLQSANRSSVSQPVFSQPIPLKLRISAVKHPLRRLSAAALLAALAALPALPAVPAGTAAASGRSTTGAEPARTITTRAAAPSSPPSQLTLLNGDHVQISGGPDGMRATVVRSPSPSRSGALMTLRL